VSRRAVGHWLALSLIALLVMKLFNTLGRTLVDFDPRDGSAIGIYVCGPTVQTKPHVGHGRAAVAFDVLRRYLLWRGFDVTYVQNVTDVDDKIINASIEQGVPADVVATAAAEAFRKGYDALGVMAPDLEPKATEHVPHMVRMIEDLIAKGHAYEAGGDVYFRVRSFPGYGKLSGRNIDELMSGARVETGELKEDPLDFALWKSAKPGEPSWPSPWSDGRPGWHIECSAMAREYLGDAFAIHAGGADLVFPHHENEIAQAEAATGKPFARFWLHNGMVNLSGEKMAKSTGHVIDLLGAVERWDPIAVRLFYLRTHYRKPVEFSEEALDDAEASLERLRAFRRRLPCEVSVPANPELIQRFSDALGDDLDVAGGLAALFETVREGNRLLDAGEDPGPYVAAYDEMMSVFGLAADAGDLEDLNEEISALAMRFEISPGDPAFVLDALVAARNDARAAKQWAVSDEIRDALSALGISVEDTANGTRWHRG
jgi:cysteinyl-tRNA synthetase